eukprot:81677-Pyramimonas_sp.AAC.1
MLDWPIGFLARISNKSPRRSTVAFCCGLAAAVAIGRRPASSSSLKNSRSNSPPPSEMAR